MKSKDQMYFTPDSVIAEIQAVQQAPAESEAKVKPDVASMLIGNPPFGADL